MKKKLLAILLAALMVMTLLPTVAFAASEITEIDIELAFNENKTATITNGNNHFDISRMAGLAAMKDGTPTYLWNDVAGKWQVADFSNPGTSVDVIPSDEVDCYCWTVELATEEGWEFADFESLASVKVNGINFTLAPTEGMALVTSTYSKNEEPSGYMFLYIGQDVPAAPNNKSNIKGTITAGDFAYTMVIPASTVLTEDNHTDVLLGTTSPQAPGDGIVSVKNIKHGGASMEISYTVDLENGNLKNGSNTIATTYKYKQGTDEFATLTSLDTKVTVYTGGEVKDSFVNVTADETQWNNAPVGEYNAVVVFNFDSKEAAAETKTVADILNTVDDGFPEFSMDPDVVSLTWLNGESESGVMTEMLIFMKDFANSDYVALNTELSADNGNYKCTSAAGATITFTMTENKLTAITVSGDNSVLNGTYTARKSLTLAGALSSLGVLPTDYSTGIANFEPLEEHKNFKYYQEESNLVIDNNDGTKKEFSLTDTVLIWSTSGVYVVELDDGYKITVYTVGNTSDGALDYVLFSSDDLGFRINININ